MIPSMPTAGSPLTAMSTQLIVIGLVLSLLAIPQVRNGLLDALERFRIYFYGPEQPETAEVVNVESTATGTTATARREIDDFDLSVFEE